MNIIIAGAGDIGYHLAKKMSLENYDITLIDKDPIRVKYIAEHLDVKVLEGYATNFELLKSAGIKNCSVFASVTNNDEVNIVACQMAKKMGVDMKIARVRNPDYAKDDFVLMKEELGPDLIIQPEREVAKAIVQLIKQSNATDLIDIEDGKIQFLGIRLEDDTEILHVQLKDLGKIYGNPPMRILAIKRNQYTIIPKGDDILVEGDQIYIISSKEYLPEALRIFGKSKRTIQNCMVIGGGLVAKFISRLIDKGVRLKIIELDLKKSTELAEKCPNSLVINGDGSDLDLLTYEGITDMDFVISVTGDDETNIITGLVAKHLVVPRTITLIRKMEYLSLTSTVGLDSIVNKQLITVNAIQKFIRRKQIAHFAELPGLDAEIIEFVATDKSKIIKKPLININFPKDAIVGAVMKKNYQIEIPKGSTQIESGDKVIIFTAPKALKDVEKLF